MRLDRGQIEVVDDLMADVLRSKSPAQRIAIGFNIWISARKMLMAYLKSIHSDWSDGQISQEVLRRIAFGSV